MNHWISLVQPLSQHIKLYSVYSPTSSKQSHRTYMDVPKEIFLVIMMLLADQKEELFWLLRQCGKSSSYHICEGGDWKMQNCPVVFHQCFI